MSAPEQTLPSAQQQVLYPGTQQPLPGMPPGVSIYPPGFQPGQPMNDPIMRVAVALERIVELLEAKGAKE